MVGELVASDSAILDLLRRHPAMSVTEMADALDVTATAVRQRLTRLMAQGYIQREATKAGRGRPSHQYSLTKKGRQQSGGNFADLATILWHEIRAVRDPDVRRGLLSRISQRMAAHYGDRFRGKSLEERLEALVGLMAERRVPFEVEEDSELPILHALACPYPELAEVDRGVCAMERSFLAEVLDTNVRLDRCRLDGETCCTFAVGEGSEREQSGEAIGASNGPGGAPAAATGESP